MITRVWACYFSPSDHTKKVVTTAAQAAAEALGLDHMDIYDWTLPAAREACPAFTEKDLVFAGTPTYAGRVPNKIMPYIRDVLKGNGAYGAAIVTYGNRSFDESLMELGLLMEANGFVMVSAGAACCQHVFSKIMAAGRPDASDLDEARIFGQKSAKKATDAVGDGLNLPPFESLGTPGHNPVGPYYTPLTKDGQPARFLKAVPKLDIEKCDHCNICAAVCPMGNISADDIAKISGPCIKCQACVLKCPNGARYFDDPVMMSHKEMLEENYGSRHGENAWYL